MRYGRTTCLTLIVLFLSFQANSVGAQQISPRQPQIWLIVSTSDNGGAEIYPPAGGAGALGHWPDGTAMGLSGDAVADNGPAWVRVQDPILEEGWVMAQALTEISPQILTNFANDLPVGFDWGGVFSSMQPGSCPRGFPVRGQHGLTHNSVRVVRPPADPTLDPNLSLVCFRSTEEAAAWGYVPPDQVSHGPTQPLPVQPGAWRLVTSEGGVGVTMYDTPGGNAVNQWPDGTALGVFGDTTADPGPAWVRVQPPDLTDGWMRADQLAHPGEPVQSATRAFIPGGVWPVPNESGGVHCPYGFDIEATVAGRQAEQRDAYAPDYRDYSYIRPYVCFRSLQEAAAFTYKDGAGS